MPTFTQIRTAISEDKDVMLLGEMEPLKLNLERISKMKDPNKRWNELDDYVVYERGFLLAPKAPSYEVDQLQQYLDEIFPDAFIPEKTIDFKVERGVLQFGVLTYRSGVGKIERRFVAEDDSLKKSEGLTDGQATLSRFTVFGTSHVVLYPSEAIGRDVLSGKLAYGKPGILTFIKLDDLDRYKAR